MAGGIGGVAGGVLGAIAGGAGNNSSSNASSSSTSNINLLDFASLNKGASGLEQQGYNAQVNGLDQLSQLVNAGPGQSAVTDATAVGNQYSSLLSQFINSSGLPTAQQTSAAQGYAQSIFAPQQTALQQSFIQQNQSAARSAALMGRGAADPALLAKLGISETQQQALLNSQQGALASQTAMQLPGQQLNLADSLYQLKQGLATQAMNNRSTLLSLGNQLANSERSYRLQTAQRTNTGSVAQQTTGGGGIGGAISGLFAGVGGGAKAGGTIASMFNSSPTPNKSTGLDASNVV